MSASRAGRHARAGGRWRASLTWLRPLTDPDPKAGASSRSTDDYVGRILPKLDPKTIVITHHDDFFRSLDEEQGLAFGVDVSRFTDEVAAVTTDARLVTLR